MKRLITYIRLVSSLLLLGASACDYIHDDTLPPCEFRLHYVYDYNMKFADAFQHEVDQVSLFICDDQGTFLRQRQIEGDELKANDIRLDLPPGTYYLVSWAGLDEGTYQLPQLTPGTSPVEDIRVRTLRRLDGTHRANCTPFGTASTPSSSPALPTRATPSVWPKTPTNCVSYSKT